MQPARASQHEPAPGTSRLLGEHWGSELVNHAADCRKAPGPTSRVMPSFMAPSAPHQPEVPGGKKKALVSGRHRRTVLGTQ